MAEIAEATPSRGRKSPARELLEICLLALAVAILVRSFVVEVYRVDGNSMADTLHSDERVLVNKFTYRIRQPVRGDVIVFGYPRQPEREFIKRVVAVAGDQVEMREGKVFVNGELFPEVETVRMTGQNYPAQTVPADSVWVLGDNRDNSEDSRYFGPVPLRNVRGHAIARIWPFDRIAAVP